MAVECGTHDDPASVDVAEACARRSLQALGVLDGPPPPSGEHVVHVRVVDQNQSAEQVETSRER